MGAELTKKLGPLPVWAWGLLAGGVVFYVYRRESAASSSTTTAVPVDDDGSNAIDPADPSASGSDGTDPGTSGAQTTVTPPDEFGDFLTFMGEWSQVAQSMGWVPPGTTATSTTDPSGDGSSVPAETINITTPAPSVATTPKNKPKPQTPAKPPAAGKSVLRKVTPTKGPLKGIPTVVVGPKPKPTPATKPKPAPKPAPKPKPKAGRR